MRKDMNISENHIQTHDSSIKEQGTDVISDLGLCTADSTVITAEGTHYIQRLCKHFKHKVPALWNDHKGHIEFAMGDCFLSTNEESLLMQCQAKDAGALSEIIETMQSHLLRFSRDEIDAMTWKIINA